MSEYIKRGTWIAVALSGCLMVVSTARAASFDCAKAGTKVEHIICDNAEISRLDDDLSTSYKAALQDKLKVDAIKQSQKQWINKRNNCTDADCVKATYQNRISKLTVMQSAADATAQVVAMPQMTQHKVTSHDAANQESYTLVMSKDSELCNHMLKLFNDDLEKYGWNGDAHQEEHEEFRMVPWKPARFSSLIDGRIEYTDVEGALFDFNNDGVQDFVVRWKATLSGIRADLIDVFDANVEKRADELNVADIGGVRNTISLAGWWYKLLPPFDSIAGVQVLEPFIYHGTSYLVMRPLFEDVRIKPGYAVIARYGGGKFIHRELTGKMEDICYYRRSRATRAH